MTTSETIGTNPGAYVSVPEAAKIANLSERAIRRALSEVRLDGITVDGGRRMVSRSDLDRFARIARRRTAPSGTSSGAGSAGAGTKTAAPSGTSPIPVPDRAAVMLAAQIDDLHIAMAVMLARVEVLEAALSDAKNELMEAAPTRRWWHRFMALGEAGNSPAK